MNDATKKILYLLFNSMGIVTNFVISVAFAVDQMGNFEDAYEFLKLTTRWKQDLSDGIFCELSYLDVWKEGLCELFLSTRDAPDKNYEDIMNGIAEYIEDGKTLALIYKEDLHRPVGEIEETYTYSHEALETVARYLAS